MKLQSMIVFVVLVVLLSACIAPAPAAETTGDQPMAESDDHEHMTDLAAEWGEVDFPVSCTAEAQTAFSHAMAILHSFEYIDAIKAFNAVAELDPNCAMAHWGVAMSLVEPLWGGPSEQDLVDGRAAIEKALAVGEKTPREQAYIDAIATYYRESDASDHHMWSLAYEAAMAQLAQDYPDDTEAQIFYALALMTTALPTDKEFTNQHKAIEILTPIFVEQPDHPGAAHYLIHSNDYPALAEHGLEAALSYADIAPAAPHALHMPSHIFTRLGYWQESIETNLASAAAARAHLPESDGQNISSDSILHSQDYMMYAYLQLGLDGAAKVLLDEIYGIEKVAVEEFGAAYALAAIPARYVLERGQWGEAAALALHPQTFGWENFPQAEASLVFARGMGAARTGDADAARQEFERLQVLHEALVTNGPAYWAGEVEIQSRAVEAWIALAEGRNEEALALMHEAAELEDATEKHPVSPGRIVPARELLGEMLIALEQPEEALAQFEASLLDDPNRFRGLYGAAHAAELAGEVEKAQRFYAALRELAANADGDRAELAEAEAFLAQ